MFTGIVEEVGTVIAIRKMTNSASIEIKAEKVLSDVKEGDSIAVNGVCLTVTSYSAHSFTADIMHETMRRSSMKDIKKGTLVNLERAMMAGGRFGGHMVTGHIDGVGTIEKIQKDEIAIWYTIAAEDALMHYIVEKGSIAIDGISLTVASVEKNHFCVSVIPHTMAKTILTEKKPGDLVNLENDCIGKYVAHFLHKEQEKEIPKTTLTKEFLYRNGF